MTTMMTNDDDDDDVNSIVNDPDDNTDDNDDGDCNIDDDDDDVDDNRRVNDPDDTLNGGILNFLLHFYLSPGSPPATWEPRGHRDDVDDEGDDGGGACEDGGDGCHHASLSLHGYHFILTALLKNDIEGIVQFPGIS